MFYADAVLVTHRQNQSGFDRGKLFRQCSDKVGIVQKTHHSSWFLLLVEACQLPDKPGKIQKILFVQTDNPDMVGNVILKVVLKYNKFLGYNKLESCKHPFIPSNLVIQIIESYLLYKILSEE